MKFELSFVIFGHQSDVRAVGCTPDGQLLTGSRDCTAKLWESIRGDRCYEHLRTFEGHSNFVSAVCALVDSSGNSFVVTGSNDKKIRVFGITDSRLVLVINGHNDTVCALSPGKIPGTLVSSSWDKTAALWNISSGTEKPLTVLSGHTQAVWAALQMPSGLLVTGSADKSIKVWQSSGGCIHTLQGHVDCVRGLVAYSNNIVLSSANDATVKMWNIETFVCLGTYYSHTNYVYGISLMPGEEKMFVTCGEDSCFKVWKAGDCLQTVALPCQSAWAITCLPNGDIAVGSSDGAVRIFTANPERMASAEERAAYESSVTLHATSALKETMADLNTKDLPGTEALQIPGDSDGKTKLVNENGVVTCYKWSASASMWEKVGEVVGANSGKRKTLYDGKEYDYVFHIDIEDGKPPLKLPFNNGEDPWTVAQAFIHKHNISQSFLEQVANFIISNAKKEEIQCMPGFSDPFTGENRYVPLGPSTSTNSNAVQTVDDKHNMEASKTSNQNGESEDYFPQRMCVAFNVYNSHVMRERILQNNEAAGELFVPTGELLQVLSMLEEDSCDSSQINTLLKMLNWPGELIIPVLDLLRVAVRNKAIYKQLFSKLKEDYDIKADIRKEGFEVMAAIQRCMQPGSSEVCKVLALRTVCNIMMHQESYKLFLMQKNSILSTIQQYMKPYSKHMQMVLSTLMLNLAVAANHERDVDSLCFFIPVLFDILLVLTDFEAKFRALVALGTILFDFSLKPWEEPLMLVTTNKRVMNMLFVEAAGSGAPSSLSDDMHQTAEKVQTCALQLVRRLTNALKT